MTKEVFVKSILPISLLFSGSLILSNKAYLYLSVSFIQMLKARSVYICCFMALIPFLGIYAGVNLAHLVRGTNPRAESSPPTHRSAYFWRCLPGFIRRDQLCHGRLHHSSLCRPGMPCLRQSSLRIS